MLLRQRVDANTITDLITLVNWEVAVSVPKGTTVKVVEYIDMIVLRF